MDLHGAPPSGIPGARRLASSPDRAEAPARRSRTRKATLPTTPSACLPRRLANSPASCVDFAEDLHNGIGIWAAYERYNAEFFGTALPLTSAENGGDLLGFHPDRFRHFLWVLYPVFI